MPVKQLTTHTTSINGRTSTLTLHSISINRDNSTDISEVFTINGLVKVRAKVVFDSNKPDHHDFFLTIMAHELAKDATIIVNISCDKLQYADKWICSGKWIEWIHMGNQECTLVHTSAPTYISITEIIIKVNKITPTCIYPKLYEDSDLTDFTLSTPDGNVEVHRACLAAHSPVFRTMFTGTWKETKENLIEIKGCTRQTVQYLKEFLYLGTLPDDDDRLRQLITLAALYSIKDLKKECARKLVETVQPEDLYSLHELACENNIPELSYALAHHT